MPETPESLIDDRLDFDWHSVDETPVHGLLPTLTHWSDGDYEVVIPADYPEFWAGLEVSGAVLTHWRYIDPPVSE